jgi:[methyl-Co(III) methanol-specific corrinoid protein]:coenzyme M methyltransferase
MAALIPSERLSRVLAGQSVDRPPVLCTGGMMNAAIVDVMRSSGHDMPEAHQSATGMAGLAGAVSQATGFENIGVPFCMTVEAELFGSSVDYGTQAREPRIVKERYTSARLVPQSDPAVLAQQGRAPVVAESVERLQATRPSVPVVATLTGPLSTLASVVDPMTLLKELRTDPQAAGDALAQVTRVLVAYARELVRAGVDAVAIGDPTATVEILGPKLFQAVAIPALNELCQAIHSAGRPTIVHICGKLGRGTAMLPELVGNAISVDALVDLKQVKASWPSLVTMGNLSTFLLEWSGPAAVADRAKQLVRDGVDIIAPACGLSTSTPLHNVVAMTRAVQETKS